MFVDGVTVGRTTVMGVVEVCSSLAIVASFLSSSPCFFFFSFCFVVLMFTVVEAGTHDKFGDCETTLPRYLT